MAKIDNKANNTQQMMMHSTKQKTQLVGKIEEFDLGSTDVILFGSSDALNAADKSKLPLVMRPNPENHYISSDPEVDEQLMIKLSFRDPVSITHLIIRADRPPNGALASSHTTEEKDKDKDKDKEKKEPEQSSSNSNGTDKHNHEHETIEYSGPRMIKLFANKPELDFEDAEDTPVAQQLVLTEKDLTGEKLALKSLKFQRCNSFQILIVDNQHDTEVTYLNRIGIIGRLAKSYHTDFND